MKTPQSILSSYWGYSQFRPQQLAVIESVLAKKDTLTLLPTGAGKSICFQVPPLCNNSICIIISPLIALMQDQVKDLQSKNIKAISLGAHLNAEEQTQILADIKSGQYQFIYCSPEKLAQTSFQQFLQTISIGLFAIDEAHCISQWGYDFRPSYRKLGMLKKLFPQTPILAMTASAIPLVQADIIQQLQLKEANVLQDSFLRPRLKYQVQKVPVKLHTLRMLLMEDKDPIQSKGSSIIYCTTRNSVDQLTQILMSYGFSVAAYHAGLPLQERQYVQQQWMQNKIQIMVCTNAFGMGINKPDVRKVIHYDLPNSLEQYYQEAGRAGRDGNDATALLLYQQNDWDYWEQLQTKKYPPIDIIKQIYQDLADFVQLPIGMGEKQQFLFDFENFCLVFKWDKIVARNALQWIAQEGHVQFSDSQFKPSMIQVIANRQSIEQFEQQHIIPGKVLQTLLRSYGGILDSPQYIHEGQLGTLLQRDIEFVKKQLIQLTEFGLISYEQKGDQPIVEFKWNRTSAAFMKLDFDNYTARKKAFLDRIDCFTTYIQGRELTCRSSYLASYFGEKAPIPCGICDLCTSTKD